MVALQYNTTRKYLDLREYGRHLQRMVDYLLSIKDRKKRNEQARSVIELMGTLNPHLKNVEDYRHMLWDHLFEMSNFKLDVDSPYPIPTKETYKQKSNRPMKYPVRNDKYAHLGKNVLSVVQKALKEENPERKVAFADSIAYYMKVSYSTWHKEEVADELIRTELRVMTNGKLSSSPVDPSRKALEVNDKVDYNKIDLDNRKQNFGNRLGGDTSLIGVPKKNKGNGSNNNNNNNKKPDNKNGNKGNFGSSNFGNSNKNNFGKKRF